MFRFFKARKPRTKEPYISRNEYKLCIDCIFFEREGYCRYHRKPVSAMDTCPDFR